MSLERNIERIADALEKLTTFEFNKVGPIEHASCSDEPSASGGAKATPKTTAEKNADKVKKAKKMKETLEKKKADAASDAGDGVTREDVQAALVAFVKNGPGKAAAKEVFEEFKAGSISTLDNESYEAFIFRLKEVADAA